MTTANYSVHRWRISVVLIWCWKPRSFLESYWSPVPIACLEELRVLSVEAAAAVARRGSERRPSTTPLAEGTAHNQGRSSHTNQGRQDRSSGETPYPADSSLWQVDTKANYTEKMKVRKN